MQHVWYNITDNSPLCQTKTWFRNMAAEAAAAEEEVEKEADSLEKITIRRVYILSICLLYFWLEQISGIVSSDSQVGESLQTPAVQPNIAQTRRPSFQTLLQLRFANKTIHVRLNSGKVDKLLHRTEYFHRRQWLSGPKIEQQKDGTRIKWCCMKVWNKLTKKFGFFCTLSLTIRIFLFIYKVLLHYYDEQRSHESWSSLLTSLTAENNGGFENLSKNIKWKHCWVFSDVLSCYNSKTQSWTVANKLEMTVCVFPEAAESDVFGWKAAIQLRILVSVHERAPLNSCLLKPAFFVECWSIWYASKPPLFSASGGLSNELQLSWLHHLH